MLPTLILILWVLFLDFVSPACVHDQLEDVAFQKSESGADTAAGAAAVTGDGSSVTPNFRINLDWSNFESDVGFDSSGAKYIRDVVMASAEQFFEQSIQVRSPPTRTLIMGARTCTATWQSGTNKGKCSLFSQTLCGPAVVPSEHLATAELCNTGSGTCTILIGSGVSSTDLVVYVAAKSTSSCTSGALAYAGACSLDSSTDRPLFGYMNICPSFIATATTTESRPYRSSLLDVMVVVHEMTHVLGFARNLFPYWRRDDGSYRTPRNSDGSPQAVSASTVNVTVERGAQISRLVTEKVVSAVREFFNCPTAEGAELEDGGTALSMGSHWEKRVFQGEYMVSDAASPEPVVSQITFAALGDTGWYIMDTSMARQGVWGYAAGCDFLRRTCIVDRAPLNGHFCANQLTACNVERSGPALCTLSSLTTTIPVRFQYFGSTSIGGTDTFADYCPFYRIKRDSPDLCFDETKTPSMLHGEAYGLTSRCFKSSLSLSSATVDKTWGGNACYPITCDATGTTLSIMVNGVWYACTAGGTVKVPGFSGAVNCPSGTELPWLCQVTEPLFPVLYDILQPTTTPALVTTPPRTSPATTSKLATTKAGGATTHAAGVTTATISNFETSPDHLLTSAPVTEAASTVQMLKLIQSDPSENQFSPLIAGLVICVVLCAGAVGLFCFIRRRRSQQEEDPSVAQKRRARLIGKKESAKKKRVAKPESQRKSSLPKVDSGGSIDVTGGGEGARGPSAGLPNVPAAAYDSGGSFSVDLSSQVAAPASRARNLPANPLNSIKPAARPVTHSDKPRANNTYWKRKLGAEEAGVQPESAWSPRQLELDSTPPRPSASVRSAAAIKPQQLASGLSDGTKFALSRMSSSESLGKSGRRPSLDGLSVSSVSVEKKISPPSRGPSPQPPRPPSRGNSEHKLSLAQSSSSSDSTDNFKSAIERINTLTVPHEKKISPPTRGASPQPPSLAIANRRHSISHTLDSAPPPPPSKHFASHNPKAPPHHPTLVIPDHPSPPRLNSLTRMVPPSKPAAGHFASKPGSVPAVASTPKTPTPGPSAPKDWPSSAKK